MEARKLCAALVAVLPVLLGASYRTQNFIVNAPNAAVAKDVGDAAERYREELATEWLGRPLPPWGQPCPITVQVGRNLGAGGATSFVFDRGEVFGWTMTIQGSHERIIDSVLPHEVTHTIFASHFRQPVPRWADEGACTTVEHVSERTKQQQMLIQFLKTGRGIAFSSMFAMKEYPADVLPLYAQGHSLATYFISQGGKAKYLQFLADGMQDEDWTAAVSKHYGYADLAQLQNTWLDWVRSGSRPLQPAPAGDPAILLTSATADASAPAPGSLAPAAPNLPTPPLNAMASNSAPNNGPESQVPLFQWTNSAEGRKRSRPTPNLVHHAAPNGAMAAGTMVPVQLGPTSAGAPPAGTVPNNGAPPVDPFAAASQSASTGTAHSALSSGVHSATSQSGPVQTSASRPQPPQTPGQIVLEWSKPAEPPIVGYSSAPLRR
ncbi:MAG: hypothetical protein C0483_15340 [Pirellula sp.]|nr:hypothetical protein [Pirellula sp.]